MNVLIRIMAVLAVAMIVGAVAFGVPASAKAELVAYWEFDDGVTDSSGSTTAHNGTATSVNYSTDIPIGASGKSLDLTTTDGYVDVTEHADLNTAEQTLAYWVDLNNVTPEVGTGRVTSRHLSNFETGAYSDRSLKYYKGGTSDWLDTGYDVAANAWTHIAFVISNDDGDPDAYKELDVYANGSLVCEDDLKSTLGGFMRIGQATNDVSSIKALIDDMGIWDATLSGGEIKALHTLGTDSELEYKLGLADDIFVAHSAGNDVTLGNGDPWEYETNLDSIKGTADPGELFTHNGSRYLLLKAGGTDSGTGMKLVPEPGTFVLLGMGALALLLMRLRRRR